MKFNKYLPFAFVYFFINPLGLPLGLTYTALLGPFFYGWVLLNRKKELLLPFLLLLLPFIIVQVFISGVELNSYVLSLINIIMIYSFGQAVYTFLKQPADHEWIFRKLLQVNFVFCLIALVFYFTPWQDVFWIRQNLTRGVDRFLRLKMFTYEASHYALLFVPLFFYFGLQYLLKGNKIPGAFLLLMLFLPLLLSFSAGVISCLLVALLITFLVHFRRLVTQKRVFNSLISVAVIAAAIFLFLFVFYRDNSFFQRLQNIFSGEDTSAQGRTANAFRLALMILEEKNPYFGIGPGQLKFTGEDIIRAYYLYYDQTPVAIPNAAAETLLLFGWLGFVFRLLLQVFLFFYTRVWSSYYRLLLFLFMFVYQFTGSYISNPAEYVIWILAFTAAFPQFDIPGVPLINEKENLAASPD